MSKIPGNPSEVSEQWLQKTLELKFTDVKIEQLKQHKNEGGVLSGIFKANVKLNGSPQKLFIKIMPDPSQPQRVFIENFGIDAVEVNTYKDLFEQLEAFEIEHTKSSEIKQTICDFYGGNSCQDPKDRKFYLILEDLGDTYKMPNLEEGMTNEQITSALTNLAYFHALSYAYGQINELDYLSSYPMIYHRFLKDKEALLFIDQMFERAHKALLDHNEADLGEMIEKLSKNYVSKLTFGYGGRDGRFLTHGDMWSNNVMFDDQNQCKLVDWQFTCASDPYLDFAAMAFLNQDPDKIEANTALFCQVYFEKFQEIIAKFKIQGPWKDLEEFTILAIQNGYLALFCWLVPSFSPCVYAPKIEDRFIHIFKKAVHLHPTFFT